MNLAEFQNHMNRLIGQFGKATYTQVRCELIWREVKDFDARFWERCVDKLLGECRQAPLMEEFRREISFEREKTYQFQKAKDQQESIRAMKALFDHEQIQSMCATIQDRMKGDVTDETFNHFKFGLAKLANIDRACSQCDGTGYVFKIDQDSYEWTYRCYCMQGDKKPSSYPRFERQEREVVSYVERSELP